MKALKITGIVLGVLLGLFVLAAMVVPLVVNVDDYRPKIVAAAEEHLNGKLDLGPLSLSLWGQVKVKIGGFTLSDAKGRKVVAAQDVSLHVPFWSILLGSPAVTFLMKQPELSVWKDRTGKLNVLTLVKGQSVPGTPASRGTPAEPSKGLPKLPGIAVRSKIDIDVEDAVFSYQDEKSGLTSKINDFNLKINDLSLSHPMDMDMWATMDTTLGKTLIVKGPAKMHVDASPKFEAGSFSTATLKATVNLDDLVIQMPGTFEKKKGQAANATLSASTTPQLLTVEKMAATFAAAELDGSGTVSKLDTDPEFNFKFTSNEIPLKPWAELVPLLKEYELGGSASLEATLTGTTEKLGYTANLLVKNVTAKSPQLKAQPVLNGRIHVITDKVDVLEFSMKAPGNELRLAGNVSSFVRPQIQIQVSSTGMDLDQLIRLPAPSSSGTNASAPASAPARGANQPASDFDKMLDPVRTTPMLAGTNATARCNLDFVKIDGVKMTNLVGTMTFRDLTASIASFRMGVWSGVVTASGAVQMRPRTPQYKFNASVAGMELKQAVESQLELFKNTLLGKASFKIEGTGASFNPPAAKGNLNAKGNLSVQNATFATIDIGKIVTEAANRILASVAAKVPALKSSSVKPPASIDSKYSVISSDFTIANGVFNAPNFTAKAEPNRGLDLKGDTMVGIKDYSLKATWEISDTYNLSKLKDVTVDQAGVKVEHILAEGNGPVKLPIQVGGTVFSPQVNYAAVAEALGKVALGNIGKGLQNKAQQELQKKANETLQNFGKKLFGK